MECSMNIDMDCYDGYYETIEQKIIESSGEKVVCGECRAVIEKGQNYEKYVGEIDNEINTHITCSDCLSMRDTFFYSFTFRNIWEDLEGEFDQIDYEVPEACLRDLTPKAREKVCGLIEEFWEDEEEEEWYLMLAAGLD